MSECSECDGRGEVLDVRRGHFYGLQSCPKCRGKSEDMSDEDAQVFDAHHNALEELRKNHSEFLETVEAIMSTAAEMAINGAKAVAPYALEVVKNFAMAALEKELNRHSK